MGLLRNAVKRKEHKERSQPAARKHLGLLEKKKDYRKRADDFNRKRRTIQELHKKASEKNPDEFYFAMEHASTKDGVHIARTTVANKYSQEELAFMRTQDSGYLRLKAQAEAKKLERLKATLHLTGQARPNQKTLFEDESDTAQPRLQSDAMATMHDSDASDSDSDASDVHENLPEASALAGGALDDDTAARVSRGVQAQYKELATRQRRYSALSTAAQALDLKRAIATKKMRTNRSAINRAQYPLPTPSIGPQSPYFQVY